jgi:hypothetical protein
MKRAICMLLFAISIVAPSVAARAGDTDYVHLPTTALIDSLATIDAPAPGVEDMASYDGFIGDDTPLRFESGVLGVPPPNVPPQMRELVRRGAAALPELLQHLRDNRLTKLVVDGAWQSFSNEYVAREPKRMPLYCSLKCTGKAFTGTYTVKIGDICFAIIGQIVNRPLEAVRYQATAGLIVNSPVEDPALAARVKADWNNLGNEGLKAALLTDLRRTLHLNGAPTAAEYYFRFPALRRLHFYFPDVYAGLQGDDLKTRRAFEKQEKRE